MIAILLLGWLAAASATDISNEELQSLAKEAVDADDGFVAGLDQVYDA